MVNKFHYCPECGKQYPLNIKFCGIDGANLNSFEQKPKDKKTTKDFEPQEITKDRSKLSKASRRQLEYEQENDPLPEDEENAQIPYIGQLDYEIKGLPNIGVASETMGDIIKQVELGIITPQTLTAELSSKRNKINESPEEVLNPKFNNNIE